MTRMTTTVAARLHQWTRTLDCWRHGHAWQLQLAPNRITYVCPVCQTESPGWDLGLGPLLKDSGGRA